MNVSVPRAKVQLHNQQTYNSHHSRLLLKNKGGKLVGQKSTSTGMRVWYHP